LVFHRTHRNNPVATQPSPDILLNRGIQRNPDTRLSLGTLRNPAIPLLLEAPLATLRLQVVPLGTRLLREAILLPGQPPDIPRLLVQLPGILLPLAVPLAIPLPPEELPGILLHLGPTLKPLALPLALPPATLRPPEPPAIPRLPNAPRKLGPPATPALQEGTRLQEVLPGTLVPPVEPPGTLAPPAEPPDTPRLLVTREPPEHPLLPITTEQPSRSLPQRSTRTGPLSSSWPTSTRPRMPRTSVRP